MPKAVDGVARASLREGKLDPVRRKLSWSLELSKPPIGGIYEYAGLAYLDRMAFSPNPRCLLRCMIYTVDNISQECLSPAWSCLA